MCSKLMNLDEEAEGTYISHVIHKVHIMLAFKIWKWICQPNHIDIIVHNVIAKFQYLQEMLGPSSCKIEESLHNKRYHLGY